MNDERINNPGSTLPDYYPPPELDVSSHVWFPSVAATNTSEKQLYQRQCQPLFLCQSFYSFLHLHCIFPQVGGYKMRTGTRGTCQYFLQLPISLRCYRWALKARGTGIQIPGKFLLTCSTLWPLVTYSLPTFTLGCNKPLIKSEELIPIR